MDGAAIRRAADGVVALWPWSPAPPPEPPVAEPPALPADSWFAR